MPFRTVAWLLHAYIGWRLLPALLALPLGAMWAIALAVVLVVSALALPYGFGARRRGSAGRRRQALAWLGLVCMGLFSSLVVLTLLRDAGLVALLLAATGAGLAVDVAAWEHASAAAVPLAAGLVTLWGFVNARRTARLVRVDVPIAGLPAALDGFTIAQISDVHVGPTIRGDYVRRIVERVNGIDAGRGPDLVAVTGDLVDGSVAELAAHVAPLAGLRSREGTFFVTGNHEYYSGAGAWVAELRRLGLRVLLNEHAVVERGDGPDRARLVVAGVTDHSAGHFDRAGASDPARALAGAPRDAALRLLLAHQPRSAAAAERAGFDLQLSGHTHGGQFWPWNHFVRLQQPYTAGLHRLQKLWIYTSRGTGYWGPPKRFGAPSEITLLRLVSAADAYNPRVLPAAPAPAR